MKVSVPRSILAIFLLSLVACNGPLVAPAIRRLDADEQARVNRMWNNMLARPDRLDRELLLDVMIVFQLHELGVDRAAYHAEKEFAGGAVLMDLTFDRRRPLDDRFSVEIVNAKRVSIRRESYSGEEVWSHLNQLTGTTLRNGEPVVVATTEPAGPAGPRPSTRPATEPTDADLRQQWLDVRLKQIAAATQPAR